MFRSFVAIVFVALWLPGCGSMRLVDSDVRSYATTPFVPVGTSYRFERLPSQQADAGQQTRLEAMAQAALAKAGLQRNDTAARYSVQVSADLKVDPYSPWDRPSIGWRPGWNFGWGWGVPIGNVLIVSHGPFMHGFGPGEMPYYWRQVSLIIRNLSSAQVVYETHAAHGGRWADSEAVLPAMFDAALKDFPNPPQGVRRINMEIPR
nr:DUF4136 domain-containing protein [Rhodoferax sp.]